MTMHFHELFHRADIVKRERAVPQKKRKVTEREVFHTKRLQQRQHKR